jgi:hypothetical protein
MTMVDDAICNLGHAGVGTMWVVANVALRSGVATMSSFRNNGDDVRGRMTGGA